MWFLSSRRVTGRKDGAYGVRGRELEIPEFANLIFFIMRSIFDISRPSRFQI